MSKDVSELTGIRGLSLDEIESVVGGGFCYSVCSVVYSMVCTGTDNVRECTYISNQFCHDVCS
ncbi:hypothetical protein [Teredinibacter haidensis]|uniref:hypothetical protein n=1 Tax=Teredinibacter haidensis TaxID=2731755 RepID=UPI000AED69A8|nr:hypothetical protein [Teredinibacter haidensis]